MTDAVHLALLRLAALRLVGPGEPDPAAAVRRLAAVQAQDLPGAITSIALRTEGRSRDDVRAAFDTGRVVRSWPMRGTLHVVPAEDLGWMVDLTCPRRVARTAARRAGLGIDETTVARARAVALDAVAGGGATRDELLAAWEAAGLAPQGGRGYHLLGHLAETGLLCFGPTRAGEPLVVALERWVPRARRPGREEALTEWARRYFRGHGPATVGDFTRWTGLPARDVAVGVAGARRELARIEVGGVEYLMDPDTPDRLAETRDEVADVLLLPGFDEFLLGYRDRTAVLPAVHAHRVAPGGNGVFRPTVVHGGQVVGTWRAAGRGAARRLEVDPFAPLADDVAARVHQVHARMP